MYRIIKKILLIIRLVNLRKKKVFLSIRCKFNENTDFGGSNSIRVNSEINNSAIGFGTYIGKHCELNDSTIGKFCSIADNVKLLNNNHPVHEFVSTHPAFHRGGHPLMKKLGLSFNDVVLFPEKVCIDHTNYCLSIGCDVWIGEGVRILPGIKIGNGAVIACYSVVTKDVPAYAIVAGIPAKIMRFRFEEEEIKYLESLCWWDMPIGELTKQYFNFETLSKLRSKNIDI